jgi:hypothetical protein
VTTIGEVRTTLAVTTNLRMLHLAVLRSVRRLVVTASVVPSSLSLFTQMMEDIISAETSPLRGATRRYTP